MNDNDLISKTIRLQPDHHSPNLRLRESIIGYSLALPALILLIVFLILPAILSLLFSFTNFYLLRPQDIRFIGLENYLNVFQDSLFLKCLINTLYFSVVVVPIQTSVALGLALLVNQKLKLSNLYRLCFFAPVITSMVVVAILWTFLYNPNNGIINNALGLFHIPRQPFLLDPKQAMNSIIFMSIWQGAGYQMMIFLAGLQDIPEYLYESAELDGANWLQKFWHITLPCLRNVSVFIVMITTIAAFKLFIQPYVMTGGGPVDSTKTLVYLIFEEGFKFRSVGYSSAMAVIFFIMVLIISLIMRGIIMKEDNA